MSICASVFSPRIICPPDKRTFNSDGTRVSEVGLKEWVEGGKKEGKGGEGVGKKSVVGSMNLPTHGFGGKGTIDDDASLKSGLSGETLMGGKRGGSLVKRLFRRMGGEDGGKE